MKVWILTRWVWGGGGDDDRSIVGVFAAEESARAYADRLSGLVPTDQAKLEIKGYEVKP